MTPHFTASDQPDGQLPVSVRGPAALAAALPYLLPIPVQGRVVVTGVEAGSLVRGASHAALPDYPVGGSAEMRRRWADDAGALVAQGVAAMQPADTFVAAVLYLSAGIRLDDHPAMERIRAAIPPEALARSLDILAVAEGRWRSILCDTEDCCASSGMTILDDEDAVSVCAELIGAGLAAAPTPDPRAVARVRAVLGELAWPATIGDREELLLRVLPLVLDPSPVLDPADAASLILAADRPGVRDALLARLAKVEGRNPRGWAVQGWLWERVAALAPTEWLAGPACMLAVARWAACDDQGAALAVGRALAADPLHRMAGLVDQLLRGGVGADDWIARLAGLSEDDCLRFDRPMVTWRRDERRAG